MSKGEKSLWDLAIDQNQAAEAEGEKGDESSILFVGSKQSGKTSIILRFLDRDEPAKPTTALEYTFGRRAKGHNIAKDVGHIWELGGGTWLSRLIDIPINAESIKHVSIAIVLDLSKPNELWVTLEKLLTVAKARVDAVINEARIKDPELKNTLLKAAWERIGEQHPDREMIDPFLIPLVIIGGKSDVFQDFDSEKRKIICKTLRFVALSHGAFLQFFNVRQEALISRARGVISHLVFGTNPSKTAQLDHNKPLLVPPGMDTIDQIGNPPIADGDIGRVTARNPMELWKLAYTSAFPQESQSDPALAEDLAKDPQYAEHAVDTMRAQKDQELERYRKLTERRRKEAQKTMAQARA